MKLPASTSNKEVVGDISHTLAYSNINRIISASKKYLINYLITSNQLSKPSVLWKRQVMGWNMCPIS